MSEPITTVPTTQPESQVPAPEPQTPTQPEPQPAASDAEAVVAAAAAEEQRQAAAIEAAMAECRDLLKAAAKAFAKGESSYAQGLLDAGRLCSEYVAKRLQLSHKRAAAVQAIEGALAQYATDSVQANRLIGCWQAHALLTTDNPGLP